MLVSVKSIDITRVTPVGHQAVQDMVSVEEPLEIRLSSGSINERKVNAISVTMRTPGHDEELAVGFLFTEGIIKGGDQVQGVEPSSANIIQVNLSPDVIINQQSITRNFYTTSSCGVCGKASIDAIKVQSSRIESNLTVFRAVLESLPAKLQEAQQIFQSTGGLHASALFDSSGNLVSLREDVGRHNALDKVIGHSLLNDRVSLEETLLLVSGRASFELVQKAAVAGIPIMVAIGAPSSLAVELAQEAGITLIGFLNQHRFNIYSHSNRIILS